MKKIKPLVYVPYGNTGRWMYFDGSDANAPRMKKPITGEIIKTTISDLRKSGCIHFTEAELVSQGRICHRCHSLFTRENAKFPVYNEKKKTKHYICSECKFRS